MRKAFWFIIGFWIVFSWFLVTGAQAADVNLNWDASAGATGYKIYKSEDLRTTWDVGIDVGNVITYTYMGVREDGPVDFRVSAYNETGEAIRYWSGAWYDKTKMPPADPGGTGIE